MSKHKLGKICQIISVILIIIFVIKTILDYQYYQSTLNSAPFEVWILVNVVELILPAIICLLTGVILKHK